MKSRLCYINLISVSLKERNGRETAAQRGCLTGLSPDTRQFMSQVLVDQKCSKQRKRDRDRESQLKGVRQILILINIRASQIFVIIQNEHLEPIFIHSFINAPGDVIWGMDAILN